MSEIFGGGGLENAFEALGIDAKMTYKGSREPYYEVWELNKKDLRALEEVEEWDENWGFFRFSKGSNMGTACSIFTVNGHELIAWEGFRREDLRDEWENNASDEEKAEYHYRFKEFEDIYMPHEYSSLLEYFCQEIGASTETNVCALAVDLARANGMSLARLFQTFEG